MKGGLVSVSLKNNELDFDVKKGRRGAIIEASMLETPVGVE